MSQSPINSQLFIRDSVGNLLPIATGVFQTPAIDMGERRRLSVTANFSNGWTGFLVVEGTDEIGQAQITKNATGASLAWVGAGSQPGKNGFSGALAWSTILPNWSSGGTGVSGITASGALPVNNGTSSLLVSFNDVNCRWIRLNFNKGIPTAIGSAPGTGAIELYVSAKNA